MVNETFYWDDFMQNIVSTKGFRVGMVPKLHHLRFFKPVHMDLAIVHMDFFSINNRQIYYSFWRYFFEKQKIYYKPEICAQSKTIPLQSFPEHNRRQHFQRRFRSSKVKEAIFVRPTCSSVVTLPSRLVSWDRFKGLKLQGSKDGVSIDSCLWSPEAIFSDVIRYPVVT